MTGITRSILEAFAVAFPASAEYRGGRRLRLGNWEKRIPQISSDIDSKNAFLDAAEELEAQNVIEVKWARFRSGTDLEAIFLNDPNRLYQLLNRESPNEIRTRMLKTLDSDSWQRAEETCAEVAATIREYIRQELSERRHVALSTSEDLLDLAKILSIETDVASSLPIRALSTRLFRDSKRLERLIPAADLVSLKATGYRVSEHLGLSRSYPEVSFSLIGNVVLADNRWQCRGEIITIPLPTVNLISGIEFTTNTELQLTVSIPEQSTPANVNVISVENKESFYALAHRLIQPDTVPAKVSGASGDNVAAASAIVYAAGHPNPAVVKLLRTFARKSHRLYHFGDLDPDGLLILTEISSLVATNVEPLFMNANIYNQYLPYGYELSTHAIERLRSGRRNLPDSLLPVADAILLHGIGIEQEVIDLEKMGIDPIANLYQ